MPGLRGHDEIPAIQAREELLTGPRLLSDWAVQAGLMDAAIEITDDELAAAIALREAIYRTVIARLERRRPQVADVDLVNEHASQPQLTPRLLRNGAIRREGTASQLLASLAADLLDLIAGPDIEKVKRCAHPDCTRLYIDSSRAQEPALVRDGHLRQQSQGPSLPRPPARRRRFDLARREQTTSPQG